jgi:hypothetical protein
MAAQISDEARGVVEALNGLRARTACSILAIHATNATVVTDGRVVAHGPDLLQAVQHPNYWARQGYPDPASYDFLFKWFGLAFRSQQTAQEILGWAEMGQSCTMVAQAYEMVQDHAQDVGLIELAYATHWWQFARVIRNCVFHDGLVKPCGRPGQKAYTPFPVRWRDLEFVDSMIGRTLLIDRFFTKRHAFELVEDMAASATSAFVR